MHVRRATREDDAALLRMALQAVEEVPHTDLLPSLTRTRIRHVIDRCHAIDGQVACFVAEEAGQVVGLVAACERLQQWTDERYADGLLLWVDPPYRRLVSVQLIDALETWASARGLKMIRMCAPIPSQVGRVFARLDYEPIETAYVKRL